MDGPEIGPFSSMKKLRIAQLVLPWLPIPPRGYAGTERVVYNLTEGLVKRGHDVTLFSVGESKTSARLEAVLPKALGLQSDVMGNLKSSFYPLIHIAHCFEMADRFDIIHSHAQFLSLPFASLVKTPSVHTFHRVYEFKTPDEKDLVMKYGRLNFTSISNAQRISGINFIATVYNGVDTNIYTPTVNPSRDYLLWAGRVIDKKGPEEAIFVAKTLGIPLIMAGEITEPDYYEAKIKPHIDGKFVHLIREISQAEMIKLYQGALVTLVPIKWNEPFGLVPVESMACGTPVVAYANGGVKETIADTVTGFLVNEKLGKEELVNKTRKIRGMVQGEYVQMRKSARQRVVAHFRIESMVQSYEAVYMKLITLKS